MKEKNSRLTDWSEIRLSSQFIQCDQRSNSISILIRCHHWESEIRPPSCKNFITTSYHPHGNTVIEEMAIFTSTIKKITLRVARIEVNWFLLEVTFKGIFKIR